MAVLSGDQAETLNVSHCGATGTGVSSATPRCRQANPKIAVFELYTPGRDQVRVWDRQPAQGNACMVDAPLFFAVFQTQNPRMSIAWS
jgi:hypothetical protein